MALKEFISDLKNTIKNKSEQLTGDRPLKSFLKRLLNVLEKTIDVLDKGIDGEKLNRFKRAVFENKATKKIVSLGKLLKDSGKAIFNSIKEEDVEDTKEGKEPYDEAQGPPADQTVDDKIKNRMRKGLGLGERIKDDIEDTNASVERFSEKLSRAKRAAGNLLKRDKYKKSKDKSTPYGFFPLIKDIVSIVTTPIVSTLKWLGGTVLLKGLPKALGSVLGSAIMTSLKSLVGKGLIGKTADILSKATSKVAGFSLKKGTVIAARTALTAAGFVGKRVLLGAIPFTAPVAAVAAAGTAAYYGYKYLTRNDLKDGHYKFFDLLRLYLYGFNEKDEDSFYKVFAVEAALKENIKIILSNKGKQPTAKFKKFSKDQMEELLDIFDISLEDPEDQVAREVFTNWMYGRVIPVYGEFLTAIKTVHPNADIDNVDEKVKDPRNVALIISRIPVKEQYFKLPYIPLRRPDGGMQESKVTLQDARSLKERYISLLKDMALGKVDKDIGTGLFGSEKELDEALKKTNVEDNKVYKLEKNKPLQKPIRRTETVKPVLNIDSDFRKRDFDRNNDEYARIMKELITSDTDEEVDAMKIGYREVETYFRTGVKDSYKRFFLMFLAQYATGYKINDAKAITGFLGVRYLISEAIKRVRPEALNLLAKVRLTDEEYKYAKEALSWLTDTDEGLNDFLYKRLVPLMFHVTYVARNNTREMQHSWDFNTFFRQANAKSLIPVVENIRVNEVILNNEVRDLKPQPFETISVYELDQYRQNLFKLLSTIAHNSPVTKDTSLIKELNTDIVVEIEKVNKTVTPIKPTVNKPVIKNDHVKPIKPKPTIVKPEENKPKPEPGQLTKQALKGASLDPDHLTTDDTENEPQGDSNVSSRPVTDNAKTLSTPMAVPTGALDGIVFKSDYSKVRYPLVDDNMRYNFEAMAKEYHEITGKTIQVNETARTYEDQLKLYKQRRGVGVAKPGRSLHEYGIAIDINSKDANELEKLGLMKKYGFTRPISGERWHIEPIGVSLDPQRAKTDPVFRDKAIMVSPRKGGGGLALVKNSPRGRRDLELQKEIFNKESSVKINKDLSNREYDIEIEGDIDQQTTLGKMVSTNVIPIRPDIKPIPNEPVKEPSKPIPVEPVSKETPQPTPASNTNNVITKTDKETRKLITAPSTAKEDKVKTPATNAIPMVDMRKVEDTLAMQLDVLTGIESILREMNGKIDPKHLADVIEAIAKNATPPEPVKTQVEPKRLPKGIVDVQRKRPYR